MERDESGSVREVEIFFGGGEFRWRGRRKIIEISVTFLDDKVEHWGSPVVLRGGRRERDDPTIPAAGMGKEQVLLGLFGDNYTTMGIGIAAPVLAEDLGDRCSAGYRERRGVTFFAIRKRTKKGGARPRDRSKESAAEAGIRNRSDLGGSYS